MMGNANTVNKLDFTFCTIIITVSVFFLLSQATLETGHGLIDSEKISQNGSNFHWHKAAHNHKDTKKIKPKENSDHVTNSKCEASKILLLELPTLSWRRSSTKNGV